MKNSRGLPIPFLILILAGAVSLFSLFANRGTRAGMGNDDSVQMRTIEQERMAEIYFRVLSWLSDIAPRTAEPAKADPQPAPVIQVVKSSRRPERRGKIELCTFTPAQNLATSKTRAHNLN